MLRKFSIALVLFSALCGLSFAQTEPPASASPASLQVSGSVKVNSEPVGETVGTVFAGDRIETGEGAAARVALPDLALSLGANSCVTYRQDQIELCRCGQLEVTAARPVLIVLQHDAVKVSASAARSQFTLDNRGRDLRITTGAGTVQIQRGAKVLAEVSGQSTKSLAGLGCSAAVVRHTEEATAVAGAAIAASVLSESSHRPTISAVKPE